MKRSRLDGLGVLLLGSLTAGCVSTNENGIYDLGAVWREPWAHHDQLLDVRVYPYDLGENSYLACRRPCP
uniref:hypothetical protein n=1 Tax=Brevundimonas sp. TaxID=1871086 RepID=UPI002FCC7476